MPRDEPVGSFGRLRLKPTEFREQLGLIGIDVLHKVTPCFDDSDNTQLPCKVGAEQRRGRGIATGCRLECQDQPLLPMARLNV